MERKGGERKPAENGRQRLELENDDALLDLGDSRASASSSESRDATELLESESDLPSFDSDFSVREDERVSSQRAEHSEKKTEESDSPIGRKLFGMWKHLCFGALDRLERLGSRSKTRTGIDVCLDLPFLDRATETQLDELELAVVNYLVARIERSFAVVATITPMRRSRRSTETRAWIRATWQKTSKSLAKRRTDFQ